MAKTKPILTLGTPALDYPGVPVKDIIPCGPILLPAPALGDGELAAWLAVRPTVLVSLGSHTELPEHLARIVHGALIRLLDARADLQILWKLKRFGPYDLPAHDRVKIVDWLDVDPVAILASGQVVCSVHHGGSNSFHETLR
jgi:UDP:flavonoid glycosyltransferase YjiC (YdhE family)